MRIPVLIFCAALALAAPWAVAQSNPEYILLWNGGTIARFTSEQQVRNAASGQAPSPAVLLAGAQDARDLGDWNQARDHRTVTLVACRGSQEVQRQTFYGAFPQYVAITPAGTELQMTYAQEVAVPLAADGTGLGSPCTQPVEPAVTLFDRRFGRYWTVSTGNGKTDLWQYQSGRGAAAYFGDRENTTVTVELAGDTYIVDYLGCEYSGRAQAGNITLQPTPRARGTCSRHPGALHATIVR